MLKSLVMAFSIYTKIPMPYVKNAEKNMKYILSWFPMTGVFLGILQALAICLLKPFLLPEAVAAIVLTAIPALYTGGIHLDGFMDTTDALMSYRSKEEKIKIMDDPHAGAFSIIGLAIYLMCSVSLFLLVIDRELQLGESRSCECVIFIASIYVMSRALSSITCFSFRMAKKEGMLAKIAGSTDPEDSSKKAGKYVLPVLFLIAAVFIQIKACPVAGLVNAGFQALLTLFYYRKTEKEFGGICGDTAGWYLCKSEMASLFSLALVLVLKAVN